MAIIQRPEQSGFVKRLPGLVAWWDFSDLSTLSFASGIVSAVRDKSGHGNNATYSAIQSTATLKLNASTTGLAALDAFAGFLTAKMWFTTPLSITAGDIQVSMALVEAPFLGGTNQRVVQGSSNWLVGPWQANIAFYNGNGFVGTGAAPTNTWYVQTAVVSDRLATSINFFNGVSIGSVGGTGFPSTVNLGGAGAFDEAPFAYVGEIIITQQYVPSARAAVDDYLMRKWGVPSVMQAGHRLSPSGRRVFFTQSAAPTGKLFLPPPMTGLGSGGPFFSDRLEG